jgi:hypothetical protein
VPCCRGESLFNEKGHCNPHQYQYDDQMKEGGVNIANVTLGEKRETQNGFFFRET